MFKLSQLFLATCLWGSLGLTGLAASSLLEEARADLIKLQKETETPNFSCYLKSAVLAPNTQAPSVGYPAMVMFYPNGQSSVKLRAQHTKIYYFNQEERLVRFELLEAQPNQQSHHYRLYFWRHYLLAQTTLNQPAKQPVQLENLFDLKQQTERDSAKRFSNLSQADEAQAQKYLTLAERSENCEAVRTVFDFNPGG